MAARGLQMCSRANISLFLFLLLPFVFTANEIYHPDDVFSISCGSSNNFTFDGRNWISDINTKLLSETEKGESSSVSAKALTTTTIQGPYTTARVSYSQFTYSFPVTTSGHRFIRLFFHSTSYQNLDPSKTLFSVKSGEYTLLKDFNASLYADVDDDPSDTFFREYCIYVPDGHKILNITFIPSTSMNQTGPNYAFINGIEVVSMPPYVYHTRPDDYIGLKLVESAGTPYRLENNSALETMYRFNVGGRTISPSGDTGMLRQWNGDDDYVASQSGLAVEYGGKTNLRFTMVPQYTAPTELYRTLRHMGQNATMNLSFNLTWELPVDSGFNYMLRLHFCELDPSIQQAGERRFFIYIQDQMVEHDGDVLLWTSGERATPIVKDYAMIVPTGNQKKANISLKMSPLQRSLYADSVLDGLELFKISDSQGNLAGPNPEPRPKTPQVPLQKKRNKQEKKTSAVVTGVVLLSVIVVIALLYGRCGKNKKDYSMYKLTGTSSSPTH